MCLSSSRTLRSTQLHLSSRTLRKPGLLIPLRRVCRMPGLPRLQRPRSTRSTLLPLVASRGHPRLTRRTGAETFAKTDRSSLVLVVVFQLRRAAFNKDTFPEIFSAKTKTNRGRGPRAAPDPYRSCSRTSPESWAIIVWIWTSLHDASLLKLIVILEDRGLTFLCPPPFGQLPACARVVGHKVWGNCSRCAASSLCLDVP